MLHILGAIVLGILFGFVLQRGSFCGASLLSSVVLFKEWKGLVAILAASNYSISLPSSRVPTVNVSGGTSTTGTIWPLNEWHHIAMRWEDRGNITPLAPHRPSLQVWIDGKGPFSLAGIEPGDLVLGFAEDADHIYVQGATAIPSPSGNGPAK